VEPPLIDAEHALDANYARKLGVDIRQPAGVQPDSGEQALEIAEVPDSKQRGRYRRDRLGRRSVPRAELEGEMGEAQMGLQVASCLRLFANSRESFRNRRPASSSSTRIREKIGVMFGNPETTTGGRALKFYAFRSRGRPRIASIKDGDEIVAAAPKPRS